MSARVSAACPDSLLGQVRRIELAGTVDGEQVAATGLTVTCRTGDTLPADLATPTAVPPDTNPPAGAVSAGAPAPPAPVPAPPAPVPAGATAAATSPAAASSAAPAPASQTSPASVPGVAAWAPEDLQRQVGAAVLVTVAAAAAQRRRTSPRLALRRH